MFNILENVCRVSYPPVHTRSSCCTLSQRYVTEIERSLTRTPIAALLQLDLEALRSVCAASDVVNDASWLVGPSRFQPKREQCWSAGVSHPVSRFSANELSLCSSNSWSEGPLRGHGENVLHAKMTTRVGVGASE